MRDARWVAEAAEGELLAGEPSLPGPRRAVVDSREVGEGDLFVGLHGSNADGSRFAEAALDARRLGSARRAGQGAQAGGVGRAVAGHRVGQHAARARRSRPRVAARAGLPGGGRHGLHREDLDEGHPRRPAGPAHARPSQPRELEHRDRPAADRAGGGGGDRRAGPGDGDARRGPDRRAGGDRRARRRADRERRAGAPRAAGDDRACRRGEGGADPRPARRRHRGRARGRAAARGAPARRPRDDHLRARRRRAARSPSTMGAR